MTGAAEKHLNLIDEAVGRLLSRAANNRGLRSDSVRERIVASLEKLLFREDAGAGINEIKAFIDDIRADDLCLIMACENGDENAWSDLVANFDQTVKSAARKISGGGGDAEDLASSIWAELYGLRLDSDGKRKSKLAYYSGRGSLAGWLRAVVSQLAVDQFRKQSKLVQVEDDRDFDVMVNGASDIAENTVPHRDNPEDLLTEKRTAADVSAALANAVESLGAEDKLILKLYYFDDLRLKDIAESFGYHEATASRKLVRVQKEIRKSVEEELRNEHGWTESEVRGHLSETAESLGVSFEKLLTLFVIAALVQEFWG